MRRASEPRAIQLPLLDGGDSYQETLANLELRRELADFDQRLQESFGQCQSSSGVVARHLGSMIRQSEHRTAQTFFGDPQGVANAIKAAARQGTRNARHLAVSHYVELYRDELPQGGADAVEMALERTFSGRVTPASHLVDRNLGGSVKESRRRAVLTWDDGERLVVAAAESASVGHEDRDRALVAVHLRSGLSAAEILALDWEALAKLSAPHERSEVLRVDLFERSTVIHATAIAALDQHHKAVGEPTRGPVFSTARTPEVRLSQSMAATIVDRTARAAGMPSLDRRHLRAPFGVWLANRWLELTVSRAFGYKRIRDFRELVRPALEANAQIATREFLTLRVDSRESTSECEAESAPNRGGTKEGAHTWRTAPVGA